MIKDTYQRAAPFRSIDFWKSAVITMPDNSFFELMRSVFGKIKTPFNKQQLIKDLEKFLLREDIQKTIAVYIDENDIKVIAAVALFGEPVPGDLESFFTGELSYMQLQDIILNLEERFILYRFNDDTAKQTQSRLALNPVLEEILAPIATSYSILFSDKPAEITAKKPAKAAAVLNDHILAGLLSFVSQWQIIYKKEGTLRKQIIDAGIDCFPGLDLQLILGALQILGLFYTREDKLLSDKRRFSDIALLSARERMEYCAAAMLVYGSLDHLSDGLQDKFSGDNFLSAYYKAKVRDTVNFFHAFLDSLLVLQDDAEKKKALTKKALVKLIMIQESRSGRAVNLDLLIEILIKTGLVIQVSQHSYQLNCAMHTHCSSTSPITMDSGSSVIVYPELSFADAVELASFLNVGETGAVSRFELEKNSAVRAFDNGINAQQIIDTLTRLSGKKIDETLAWHLKDWEKRHGEVSIKKGVVLTLKKDKQYLTQTLPLASLINETLAPGVYLLNDGTEEEAAAALNGAGIDIIARGKNTQAGKEPAKTTDRDVQTPVQNYYPPPVSTITIFPPTEKDARTRRQITDAATLTGELYKIMDKMQISKANRDELTARIKRRLVLCEAQLKNADIRFEKLEASHMDYAGKQLIAKQAISQQSPVEIRQGKKHIYGIPSVLGKEGNDLVLVVNTIGENEELHIPLAKISLLRRIKKSIFEV